MRRFVVVLRFVLRFVLRLFLWLRRFVLLPRLLVFLLLFLFEFLLLLVVALFQLLQLFLLTFLCLLLGTLSVLLIALPILLFLDLLLLLHLLLFDSLPLTILLLAQVFDFLLVLLIQLWVHGRSHLLARRRRPVVVTARVRIVPTVVPVVVPIAIILARAVLANRIVGDGRRAIRVVLHRRRLIRPVRGIALVARIRVRRGIRLVGLIRPIFDRVAAIVLRHDFSRRRSDANVRARVLRFHLALLRDADGAPSIRLNGLLLPCERHRRGRRRRLGNNRTRGELSSRADSGFAACSQNAALLRHNGGAGRCDASRDVTLVDAHHVAMNWLRGSEIGL